jgi:hypothetical protein
MNYILNVNEGMLDIDIKEEGIEIYPSFIDNKIVVRFKTNN